MDALTALHSRVSAPRLEAPGPDADQLQKLLRAAVRAPDHGVLRPWRFVVLQDEARERFGARLEDILLEDDPDADDSAREKARHHSLRAPLVIVAVAEIEPEHPKAPPLEQIMATACAVENIMVAAHAEGLGAMWRTGGWARDNRVKRALGFDDKDEIVSFLYLGQPGGTSKSVPEPVVTDYLRELP
jgi:nitroreductase